MEISELFAGKLPRTARKFGWKARQCMVPRFRSTPSLDRGRLDGFSQCDVKSLRGEAADWCFQCMSHYTPAEYVLALYVLLSRARKLCDVHIFGDLPDRSWFEEALVCHNPFLTQRMHFFEERSKCDVEASDLILSELGWFDHDYVRRTLSGEADHPKSKRPKTSH